MDLLFNASSSDTALISDFARIYYADYGIRCIGASPIIPVIISVNATEVFNLSSSNMQLYSTM